MDLYFTIKSILHSSYFNEYNIINPINIIDNVFIGNAYVASNWGIIRDYNIKHIINLSSKLPNLFINNNINYTNFTLDKKLNNLDDILEIISNIQTTSNHTSNNNIFDNYNILLIDTNLSNNISVIVIALLIYKYNFNFVDSIKYIENKSKIKLKLFDKHFILLKNKY